MNLENLEKANKISKDIEEKKISVKKLRYALSENVVERSMVIDFTGCDGIVEIEKKDFKKLCGIMLPILLNDLNELEKQFSLL